MFILVSVHQNAARLADALGTEVSCISTGPKTKCIPNTEVKVHFIVVNLRKGRRSKSNTYIKHEVRKTELNIYGRRYFFS